MVAGKKTDHQLNVDMLLMTDVKRRKSTQKGGGVMDVGAQGKLKTTLWPTAPASSEEEKNRLYNKFKKHLINIQ